MHESNEVAVELASMDDIDACLEVRLAAFASEAPTAYSSEEVQTLLSRDESDRMSQMVSLKQLFVARSAQGVVGLAGWMGENLYNLYVHPLFMRRRIGSTLLTAVEEQFVDKTSNTTLFVDAGLYTRRFYESQGYVTHRVVVSTDGLDYLEMSKMLRK